jgi:putative aldouronate transport system substrate-binding protein
MLTACAPVATQAPTAAPSQPTQASTAVPTKPAPTATAVPPAATVVKATPLEIYSRLAVPEVGAPPADWFWAKAIKDKLNIDVKVTFVATNEEYIPTLNTRAGANNLPDLFVLEPGNRSLLINLADQGLIADWTPLLNSLPNFRKLRATKEMEIFGSYNGKLFGLGVLPAGPTKRAVVAIRQDWLDKLSLKAPKTLDEALEVMKAFTTKDPDGNGKNDTYGWSGFFDKASVDRPFAGFEMIYAGYGALGTWKIDGGKLVYIPTSDDRKAALQFIKKMNDAGVIDPNWITQDGPAFSKAWKSGMVGYFNSDFCATFCKQGFSEFATANPKSKLVWADAPSGPKGSGSGIFDNSGPVFVLSQKVIKENRTEAVTKFLEWLATDGYLLTAYGQENVHYVRDANGVITATGAPKPFTDKAYQNEVQIRSLAYQGGAEELKQRYFVIADHPNGQKVNSYDALDFAQKNPQVEVTQFTLLPPVDKAVQADLVRYITENELAFVTGKRDFGTWADYIKGFEKFNLQKYIDTVSQSAKDLGIIK